MTTHHEQDPPIPLTLGRSLWAIQPDVLPRLLAAHRGQQVLSQIRMTAAVPQAARRSSMSSSNGAVAVIPLTGIITPRGSFLSMLFGLGGGLVDFRAAFREALYSPDIEAIVIDVDSPGGLVDLVPETAQEIYEARGTKPIVAVANTMAASAAYYIASQADEVVVTPSGSVGSIGVYMLHDDWSKFNEDFGVQPTYIFAGRHKIDGNPDEPLSDDARAEWQQEVDDLYEMFLTAVATGRGVTADQVRNGYGEGRTLLAARALEAGLVDRIDTLEAVIGGLLIPGGGSAAARRVGRVSATSAVEPPLLDDDEQPPAEPDADDRAAYAEALG